MTVPERRSASGGVLQGRYRLGDVLGVGGMATVYRAHDELLGRGVAVKLFESQGLDDEELRKQEIEARVLGSLSMHGLVTLLDAGVVIDESGVRRVFLVMELVEGRDLKTVLRSGPTTPFAVAHFGFDLAEALDYVHQHGVVHRDVKPANVLLLDFGTERRPRVKLADFGIATIVARGSMLEEEYTTGTAAYLSPEQAAGEPIGPATDVYSLGLVLLECLTGRLAFPGTVEESAFARLDRSPEIPGGLSSAWRGTLAAMTERRAGDRPRLDELVRAFRGLIVEDASARRATAAPDAAADAARAAAVRRSGLLEEGRDPQLDRITALAARSMRLPMAAMLVAGEQRVVVKSHFGVPADALRAGVSPEGVARLMRGPFALEDIRLDPQASRAALLGPARSVASVPLLDAAGYRIGALVVAGAEPRRISVAELEMLEDMARIAMHDLEMRQAVRQAVFSVR